MNRASLTSVEPYALAVNTAVGLAIACSDKLLFLNDCNNSYMTVFVIITVILISFSMLADYKVNIQKPPCDGHKWVRNEQGALYCPQCGYICLT
jgi:hypothetical protein